MEQEDYVEMLKHSKSLFCSSVLDEISQFTAAIEEVYKNTESQDAQSTSLQSLSKQQLISMIRDLETEKREMCEKNTGGDLQCISENDELQNDIQYLLHVNPSEYNNVKRYIKHMKQQSMARYSAISQQLQIIATPTATATPIRDSRRLPHPPRRNTAVDRGKKSDIQMLHFVISCVNWKTGAKYSTLREELLHNAVAPISNDLYQSMVQHASEMVQHAMNEWFEFTSDEILIVRLFCENHEFAQQFSRAFNMGCASQHRSELYHSARVFHYIFEYKSVPIAKERLHHLLPSAINNFGYIVKAIEVGWMCDDKIKYLVFNCSDDILIPNDTNIDNNTVSLCHDDDHLMTIAKFVRQHSFHNSVMLAHYGWNNMAQLLRSQYLFTPQAQLNGESLFDILFYGAKLYKMAHTQSLLDRTEISEAMNGDLYRFLFNDITLNLDEQRNEIVLDLCNANPKIFAYKPSYYRLHTKMCFNDENLMLQLSPSDCIYQSDNLEWMAPPNHINISINDDNDSIISEYCENDNDMKQAIAYLDCVLNVNGLLKVIANSYYNREIRHNKCGKRLRVEIEYRIAIGYSDSDNAAQECMFESRDAQYLSVEFDSLMKIVYCQLIEIVRHSLHNLSERIAFCAQHKSFIILALIYSYNYNYNRQSRSLLLEEELSLFCNKSLFEYLFFDCHHYELCELFPRNHDLLLKAPRHNHTLIEYDAANWQIILSAMPKLIHYDDAKPYYPRRIMVYLSMDVELESHDEVKWKKYWIDPHLIANRQIIVRNVMMQSCINWNNILLKRKESVHLQRYPMILLYYKMECEWDQKHTITSTVRNIHISTEIDIELNENETRIINNINIDRDEIETNRSPLIICDNLILHNNATIYSSFLNLKCNKYIDMRCGSAICADGRGSQGRNLIFATGSDDRYEEKQAIMEPSLDASPYLNRNELMFGSGGNGAYISTHDDDTCSIDIAYNDDNKRGLFHYLGTNLGAEDASYINAYSRGYIDMFCGGIGTRSNKMQNILNVAPTDSDCYFISGQLGVWFAVDLRFCVIQPTHYALRHVGVESNYLRNWQLEAKCSDESDEWCVLSQHINDKSLTDANQWAVWDIAAQSDAHYQCFRITMIGENSARWDKKNKKDARFKHNMLNTLAGVFENTPHNEYILCCGGFELYGNIVLRDNSNKSHPWNQLSKRFVYKSDFDTNGILYWIGTRYGTRTEWKNPSQCLRVRVERGKQSEKGSVDDIVSRAADISNHECCFLDYFVIDFVEIAICANKYTLKLNKDGDGCRWCIKASKNKRDWKTIQQPDMDQIETESIASFDIDCDNEYYRYFKIENMNLLNELHCCGFEIYGDIQYNPAAKYKLPHLKSGGNGGGIINLSAPNIKLDRCRLTANGQNAAYALGGGGGDGGNILIDANQCQIIQNEKDIDTKMIECVGGKGANDNNDGANGRIRLFCNNIEVISAHDDDDNDGDSAHDMDINGCCDPKPYVM